MKQLLIPLISLLAFTMPTHAPCGQTLNTLVPFVFFNVPENGQFSRYTWVNNLGQTIYIKTVKLMMYAAGEEDCYKTGGLIVFQSDAAAPSSVYLDYWVGIDARDVPAETVNFGQDSVAVPAGWSIRLTIDTSGPLLAGVFMWYTDNP